MSEEKITVDSDKVTIDDYQITDEDVVKYFEALSQDGKNLQEGLDKLLKLGALATKATTAGLTTEYIDKEMSKLQDQLSKEIEQNFGENVRKHGYGIYKIKENDYKFVEVNNQSPYLNFKIKDISDIENGKEKLMC